MGARTEEAIRDAGTVEEAVRLVEHIFIKTNGEGHLWNRVGGMLDVMERMHEIETTRRADRLWLKKVRRAIRAGDMLA